MCTCLAHVEREAKIVKVKMYILPVEAKACQRDKVGSLRKPWRVDAELFKWGLCKASNCKTNRQHFHVAMSSSFVSEIPKTKAESLRKL